MFIKIFKIVLPLILFLVLVSPSSAAQWTIDSFEADIKISTDGWIDVTETIQVDFLAGKHGIYRYIPIKYKDRYNNNLSLKFELISLKNQDGGDWKYSAKKRGKNIFLKIGDPDKLITGPQAYVISYRINRAINFFQDYDELYWNVTGSDWEVPIKNTKAVVHLPGKVGKENLEAKCFTGPYGSVEENCTFEIDDEKITYAADGYLTITAGWAKGIVIPPSTGQKVLWFLADNYFVLIPFLVFAFLFYLWWKRGRDVGAKRTIIAEYEPPEGISPAELGVLIDEKVHVKDISSTLIDLAVRGYLKIREAGKRGLFGKLDYELVKLKDFKDVPELKKFEKLFLEEIFDDADKKLVSKIKQIDLPKIKKALYREVTKKDHYFKVNPEKVRNIYRGIGFFAIVFSFFVFFYSLALTFSVALSGVLIIIFSFFMPRKTKKGVEAYLHTLGFREFLETAEKYRIKWQEKENIFEKYLPYAMVFDVADKWTEAFAGIYTTPPTWYEGTWVYPFSAGRLTSALDSVSRNINSSLYSAARGSSGFSSGGGFSGGGFGGGGGGSW